MEFGLHDLGEQFYGSQGEKRFFLTDRMVFNMTPHIIHHNRDNQLRLLVDSSHAENLDWDALTDAWYEMQMILNGGQRNSFRGGHHDVDWKYIWYFVSANNNFKYYPILGLTASWKSLQEIDGGFGPDGLRRTDDVAANTWWGFSLRDARPEMGHMLERDWGPGWTADQQRALLIPLYVAWVRKLASFDLASWSFASATEFNRPPAYVLGTSPGDSYPEMVDEEITTIKARGYPDGLINALADHGAALWPNNDWSGKKQPVSTSVGIPSGLTASAGAGRITLTWNAVGGATSYNLQRAEDSSGVYQGLGLMTTGTTWIDNLLVPGRTYQYRVSANAGTAVSAPSAAVSALVGSGLVLKWNFDETTGNQVQDATGGQVTGTLISDPVRSTGKIGNGLTLTGNTRYDRNSFVSSSQNLNRWLNRSATLMAWVKTTATGSDDDWRKPGLAGTWSESADYHIENWWYLGGLNANGTVSACYGLGNTVSSTKAINDGVWHHLAITREEVSGAIKFVIDGVAAGTGNSSAGFQSARAFGIGRVDVTGSTNWEDTYRYWPGQIDEVRIYDRALSISEVQGVYATEVNVVSPPPQDPAWQSTDIGGSVGGTMTDGAGHYEITGSGTDICGTQDGCRMVGQTLTGDGEIVAKVDSLQNTNSWAKAGVMIRESISTGSRHAFCAVTPGNGVAFQYRSTTNGSSSHIAGSRSAAPRWVRLVRTGALITGYESPDGITWTTVGKTTLSFSGPVWFGLAVTSHAGVATSAKANFSSVVMTSNNNG